MRMLASFVHQKGLGKAMFAGLVIAGFALPVAGSEQHLSVITDRELPSFDLASLDGESFDVEALAGKPWIINFWASWCGPCVEEMPAMNRAWADIEDDGIGMLAINAGETPGAIAAFLERVPVDFEILLGDAQTLPNWSVRALPTTVVVDSNGQIVYEALGPREWDDQALLDRVRALVVD